MSVANLGDGMEYIEVRSVDLGLTCWVHGRGGSKDRTMDIRVQRWVQKHNGQKSGKYRYSESVDNGIERQCQQPVAPTQEFVGHAEVNNYALSKGVS